MSPKARGASILIYVDHREANSGVAEELAALPQVRIEVQALPVGDYVLSERLVVERKTTSDFVQSILDRRLFAQTEALLSACPRPVFIVEGADLYAAGHVHPNAVRGALSYLVVLKNIPVLRTSDPAETAALLATMARHEQHGLGYKVSPHLKRRGASPAQQQCYLIEQLPNIGPSLAEALLRHFGTPEAVLTASKEELCQVPGIGPIRARKIRTLLASQYEGEGR